MQRKATPYPKKELIAADEFRRDGKYSSWRPAGTNNWLLIYTAAGCGRLRCGLEEIHTAPGDVVLYPPHAPQDYATSEAAGCWQLLWSHFHPRPHWTPWLNWPEAAKGVRMISLRDDAMGRKVRHAMREAARYCRQRLPGSQDFAMNALERAILWIHSAHEARDIDPRIRRAIQLLTDRMQEPFSLGRLARDCGLSTSRFAHLFREQAGMAPRQYQEELRIQRATQLLRFSGLSVGEVAEEAGYANVFYFSNRFKQITGASPSGCRLASAKTD